MTAPVGVEQRGAATGDAAPLLRVRKLSVAYGGLKAVDEFDLEVSAGQVVGLIGPNGAGKTTLLDGVSGFVRARGSVTLEGVDIMGLPPYKRVRAGLGRTFQTSDALRDLTTRDLIRIYTRGGNEGSEILETVLSLLKLDSVGDKSLSQLPAGTRRVVTVAAAVATNPRVLMLDEPGAGLSAEEASELTRAIHVLRDGGIAILLVDHNVGFVTRTCDLVYAMHFGKQIFVGTPEEMRRSDQVASVYLGDVQGVEKA